MEYLSIVAGAAFIAGGVLGYMLATHIHSVAGAVTRATTLHTGVPAVDAAAANLGTDAVKVISP